MLPHLKVFNIVSFVEGEQANVSHKSRRVVVPGGFSIAKCLQCGVSLHDLIFQGALK